MGEWQHETSGRPTFGERGLAMVAPELSEQALLERLVALRVARVRRWRVCVWTVRALFARCAALSEHCRDLEARLVRVRAVVTAPSYLVRGQRDPRFVVPGIEVLRALERSE